MRTSRAASAATLVLALAAPLGLAAPAQAATVVVVDPAGDTGDQRLDVVRAKVRNDDHRLVARVVFDRDRRGDLIVSVDPRGDTGVRLVARKNADGTVSDVGILPGAFTDKRQGDGATPCSGLKVRWPGEVARLVMPSRCLQDGDYGAVRFSVLTENGSDSDVAPDQRRSSGFFARG